MWHTLPGGSRTAASNNEIGNDDEVIMPGATLLMSSASYRRSERATSYDPSLSYTGLYFCGIGARGIVRVNYKSEPNV